MQNGVNEKYAYDRSKKLYAETIVNPKYVESLLLEAFAAKEDKKRPSRDEDAAMVQRIMNDLRESVKHKIPFEEYKDSKDPYEDMIIKLTMPIRKAREYRDYAEQAFKREDFIEDARYRIEIAYFKSLTESIIARYVEIYRASCKPVPKKHILEQFAEHPTVVAATQKIKTSVKSGTKSAITSVKSGAQTAVKKIKIRYRGAEREMKRQINKMKI